MRTRNNLKFNNSKLLNTEGLNSIVETEWVIVDL